MGLSISAVAGLSPEPTGNLLPLSSAQRKRIKQFLKRAQAHPRNSQITLDGYLLLPVQRVPRYRLMVSCLDPPGACLVILPLLSTIAGRPPEKHSSKEQLIRRSIGSCAERHIGPCVWNERGEAGSGCSSKASQLASENQGSISKSVGPASSVSLPSASQNHNVWPLNTSII
jgi:hypothetical protein